MITYRIRNMKFPVKKPCSNAGAYMYDAVCLPESLWVTSHDSLLHSCVMNITAEESLG